MRDYQESVTTGQTLVWDRQTHGQTDAGQSGDPFVPLCFAGDTKMNDAQIVHV